MRAFERTPSGISLRCGPMIPAITVRDVMLAYFINFIKYMSILREAQHHSFGHGLHYLVYRGGNAMRYGDKENFNRTIRYQHPSHVPWPVPSRGVGYFGSSPSSFRPSPSAMEWRDMWGVGWTDAHGEVFPTLPAISSFEQIDDYTAPDPHEPGRLDDARARLAEIDRDRYFVSVNHTYFMYERGFNVMGPEQFLMLLLADPDRAHRLLDTFLGFDLGIAEEYVTLNPDHINIADDYGMQDRLAVGLDTWREFFKGRLKRLVDFYHDALGDDITISLHSCGHVMPILEDLIEVGIDILNPIQSTANDLPQLRRITSGRLALAGGIDGQRVLPNGTPDEVRDEVRRKLTMLWEDGGYLPMPEKMLGVSEQNRQAMEAAIVEWSREHVEAAR
ncbi:MAG: hypothetical protein GF331_05255 [Chitinivibrionales bacterium]|nr:hypothetical protein [Chitinivibrionales bacterium]